MIEQELIELYSNQWQQFLSVLGFDDLVPLLNLNELLFWATWLLGVTVIPLLSKILLTIWSNTLLVFSVSLALVSK